MRQCCVTGFKHEGTPVGKIEKNFVETKLGPVEAYISEPTAAKDKEAKRAILFVTDVFGHDSNNAQLLADQFASEGYYVIVPDLFYGDSIDFSQFGNIDIMKWLGGEYSDKKVAHTPESIDPIIEASIKKMKEGLGFKQLGAVGYCFGAKYVVRYLKDGVLDAGFVAHPSFVTDEELAAITKPLTIAAAEFDDIFPTENRHRSEQILIKADVPWQISVFGAVSHGFAVRGDITDKRLRFAMEAAFAQAAQWFRFHLA